MPQDRLVAGHVLEASKAVYDHVFSHYRHLHAHPELGDAEFATQGFVMQQLETMGIPHTPIARTGVLAWIEGTGEALAADGLGADGLGAGGLAAGYKKVVALRADMDALPIQEETQLPYASQVPGVMHACGHDAHTSILLGAAQVLMQFRSHFSGLVKLFFQPAEETIGGAERMVQEGCMENPPVDRVYGLHVFPRLQTGTVEVTYGKMNASTDEVQIEIEGKSGHGAYPHDAIDALVAGAHVIVALQSIVSRRINPIESTVLTLGTMKAGVKGNVIAEQAIMKGSLRTLNEQVRAQMKTWIEQTVTHTAAAHGAQGRVTFHSGYNALINDEVVTEEAMSLFKRALGQNQVFKAASPSLGAEDFSFFLDKAPGMFYNLGCGNIERGIVYKGHHPKFEVEPKALEVGVALQCLLALDFFDALDWT